MKQRLLLFMFVLSLALSAKAYTVTFDVKFGSFMTDKQRLSIVLSEVGGEYRSYYPRYDETTGKYTVNDVPSGKYTVYANYPDMMGYMSVNELDVNADKTVPLDFTDYHKATFKAPDGFSISDVKYSINGNGWMNLYDNDGLFLYMPDGTYQWLAHPKRIADNMVYGASKQSFTMNGADRDVVFTINNNDYRKVTFDVKGIDNQPVASSISVWLESNGGYADCRLASSNLSCMLIPGKYNYTVYPQNMDSQKGIYHRYTGHIKVSATDVKVEIPYNKCKKLSVEVLGNDIFKSINFNARNSTKEDNGFSTHSLNKIGNTYSGEFYCMPGIYNCSFELSSDNGSHIMPETRRVTITGDNTLRLDLSNTYYPVNFMVVDGQGTKLQNSNWGLSVIDENGNGNNDCSMGKPFYMHNGNYRAECRYVERNNIIYQNFSVDGAEKTVTLVFDEAQYREVKISSKASVSEEVQQYLFADLGVEFYSDGYRCNHAEIDENGNGTIALPEGTYTYYADSGYGIQSLYGTITVTGKDDKLELDFGQLGIVYAKAENFEGGKEISFTVLQGNRVIATASAGRSNAVLLIPAGTYDILAIDDLKGQRCKKTVAVSAGGSVHETFSLVDHSPGEYTVGFEVYGNNLNKYTVALDGYGECEVLGKYGYGFFSNVSATESLGYTITSPGYIPFSGTIDVNEDNSAYGMINISVNMKKSLTSIDGVTADIKMAVYPTTPRNYIYIHPEAESVGTWNVQLASVTGAVVYNNRIQIDGETPLYVGNLPKGLYLLTLNNGEQRMMFKILKK